MAIDQDYYALAPGIDYFPVGEDGIVFRSEAVSLRLDGPSARLLAETILPRLDGKTDLASVVAQISSLSGDDLRSHLESLAAARVLIHSQSPISQTRELLGPFADFLDGLGSDRGQILDRLASTRVSVFGLQNHGAVLVDALVRMGIGAINLIDPYPCRPGDAPGNTNKDGITETSRQEAVSVTLNSLDSSTKIATPISEGLDRESVNSVAQSADWLVSTFDREFSAANHWVNRAACERGIPALFGQVWSHRALAGPLVLPHETACYMCWRMRQLACADDFDEAMPFEEMLDARRAFADRAPPILPPLAGWLGSSLAIELVKSMVAIGTSQLTGHVVEYDSLRGQTHRHAILFRPDCPVCKKKVIDRLDTSQRPVAQP